MWAKAPAAGGSGEPRSIVAKQHQEGGCVVGGGEGRACSQRALDNGTQEYGFVHHLVVTSHSVGLGDSLLVVFTLGCTQVALVWLSSMLPPWVWQ
jgi:hypothetical protein